MSISAIILAAGQSKRMGQPKMLLPWGNTTVLKKVVQTIKSAGIDDITIVTNTDIAKQITNYKLRITQNIANGEMLESIQLGLQAQLPQTQATLICLGDQPQVEERNVRLVVESFRENKSSIVVPSYQMRRGHPWLVAKPLWDELLQIKSPQTPRDFLKKHADKIHYINVDTPSVIEDLDTPEDYLKYKI